jgi:hypothetical protein
MRLIFQTHFFICYNKINDVNYKENISLENGMNFIEDNKYSKKQIIQKILKAHNI